MPAVFAGGEFIGGCNDGGMGGVVTLDKQGKKIVGQVRVENAHISQSVESTPSRACVYARTDSSVAWSCVR